MAPLLRMAPTSKWQRATRAARGGASARSAAGLSSRVIQRAGNVVEQADEQGLCDAFLAHGADLLGFARRSLRTPGLAEDAVQECFARAWRSRTRFDPTLGSLRTWLFTIQRRVILDFIDRQPHTATLRLDDELPETEDRLESAMLGWQVESALEKLPRQHRLVITELYFNDRTGREVAELFGIPEGTVRSRAFYALRLLRVVLEEAGWER
jgi:RNA polymerase sigma-70 factor (ECF subfamily)